MSAEAAVPVRLPRWFGGVLCACSLLLLASCGSAGRAPDTDRTPDATQAAAPDVALVDLYSAGEVATWTTVNDPVMGGASSANVAFGDGGLVFSGNISLENNGGFASARSPEDPAIGRKAAGMRSLRVHALGDGRTYLVKVNQSGRPFSYIQRFRTDRGTMRTYDLPVTGFEPVGMRLRPAPEAPRILDPSGISQISVYILDEQQGPFELVLRAIDATV